MGSPNQVTCILKIETFPAVEKGLYVNGLMVRAMQCGSFEDEGRGQGAMTCGQPSEAGKGGGWVISCSLR